MDDMKWNVERKLQREVDELKRKAAEESKQHFERFRRLVTKVKSMSRSNLLRKMRSCASAAAKAYTSRGLEPPHLMTEIFADHIERLNNPVAWAKAMGHQRALSGENYITRDDGLTMEFAHQEELLKIPWVADAKTEHHVGYFIEELDNDFWLVVIHKDGRASTVGKLKSCKGLEFPSVSSWVKAMDEHSKN